MPNIYFFFGGVFGFSLVLGLLGVYYYNKMTGLKVKMEESLKTIDVLVDRRQGQLEQVSNLLSKLGADGIENAKVAVADGQRAIAETTVPGKAKGLEVADRSLHAVLAIADAQPNILKNPEYDPLQRGIEKTNIEIDGSRRYYNALVRDYNLLVQRLPSALYALLLRLQKADYLEQK